MNQTEFQKWCEQLQLKTEASELIASIRAAPPERRVQGRAGNVSGSYPSRKMGVTIQFESHTVELWAIYLMEHDPLVLEFYDQPSKFKIQYKSLSGRKIAHYHTPDFFTLTEEPDSVQPSEASVSVSRTVVMTTAAKFPISVPTSDETNAVVQPFDLTQLPVFEEYR